MCAKYKAITNFRDFLTFAECDKNNAPHSDRQISERIQELRNQLSSHGASDRAANVTDHKVELTSKLRLQKHVMSVPEMVIAVLQLSR